MQTYSDTERISKALTWQIVKLPNGVYRVQNVKGRACMELIIMRRLGKAC